MRKLILLIVLSILSYEELWCQPVNIDSDSSIVYLKKMLQRNKKSSFALYGLASAYYSRNDYNNAILFSKQNLKEKNDFDTACHLIYACSLDRIGRIDEAVEVFEKAVKKYPNSYLIWYQYALSNYKIRNHDKVQSFLVKSIHLNPYFVDSHYLLGCSLFEKSNDASCIYPFLYGLLLDNDSSQANRAIMFLKTYIDKKPDRINIPFYETRFKVNSINDILERYFSQNQILQHIQNFEPENFEEEIEFYLKSDYLKKSNNIYSGFNGKCAESGLSESYIYYCLRSTKHEYLTIWYKNHSDQLKLFADFLDNNLILSQ